MGLRNSVSVVYPLHERNLYPVERTQKRIHARRTR